MRFASCPTPNTEQAWLSVGDFQSEADADAKAKDREETKRLLYVALTRARDRLYLASEVKDARWRAFGGSLGDILPAGLKARFEAASLVAGARDDGMDGRVRAGPHVQSLFDAETRRSDASSGRNSAPRIAQLSARPPTTSQPLVDPFELPRVAVTSAYAPAVDRRRRNQIDTSSRSLTGTLVHRLFERFGTSLAGDGGERSIAGELARLIRDEESVEAGDIERVFEHARDAYLGLCATAGAVRRASLRRVALRSAVLRSPSLVSDDSARHVRLSHPSSRRWNHCPRAEDR